MLPAMIRRRPSPPGRRAAAVLAPAMALALLTGGCDRGAAAGKADPATQAAARTETSAPRRLPLRIVCTIGMITDAARIIGGDRVEVTGLMGEGVDPHLYKASTGDVRLLSEADLILYNGLNLEGKMGDLFVRMARSRPTVAVTERIDEKLLREPPEFAGHYDPHVWFDVEMWSHAVERIRDALIELDADGRSEYERRTKDYLEELYEMNEWISEQISTIPAESRVLITAHDAFGYFGRAYDIEVRGLQGISTESEPSLKDVNDLVDLLVSRRIKAVFVESSVPRKSIEALIEGCGARGHAVRVGGELFSDAMGRAGTPEGTYVGMVRHNVETIVNALK